MIRRWRVPTDRSRLRVWCLGFLLFCCALLGGCGLFFTSPVVEVRDVAIVGLDPGGIDVELYLTVTNPNSFPITLTGYNYDLRVSALPLTKGGARQSLTFKAEAATDVRLPVRVALANLLDLLKRRPDPDRLPYRLEAALQVDTPVGERVIAVDRDGTFAIPERYRPAQWLKTLQSIVNDLIPTR